MLTLDLQASSGSVSPPSFLSRYLKRLVRYIYLPFGVPVEEGGVLLGQLNNTDLLTLLVLSKGDRSVPDVSHIE